LAPTSYWIEEWQDTGVLQNEALRRARLLHRFGRPLRCFLGRLHRFFCDPAGVLEEALKIVALASAWRWMICPRSTVYRFGP
jgi:hypothetical protein